MPVTGSATGTLDYLSLAIVLNGVDNFSKVFNKCAREAGTLTGFFKSMAMEWSQISTHFLALGVVKFLQYIQESVTIASEFERNIAIITAGLGDLSITMDSVRKSVLDLSEGSMFTPRAIADAYLFGVNLGLSQKQLEIMIPAAEKLAVASGVTLKDALESTTTILAEFGIEGEKAELVMARIAQAAFQSQTTVSEMMTAMQYAAPTMAQAGISFEETAAAISLLSLVGIKGSKAGTALREVFASILDPTEEAALSMEKLGLKFYRFNEVGEKANQELVMEKIRMAALKIEASILESQIYSLSMAMETMGVQQSKAQLKMMKIRYKAMRQGRELTFAEEQQIEKLSVKSEGLAIRMQEMSIQNDELGLTQKALNRDMTQTEDKMTSLDEVVKMNTTGTIDMVDILRMLGDSSIEVGTMLQIFGKRGGTGLMAINNAVKDGLTGADLYLKFLDDIYAANEENSKMQDAYNNVLNSWIGTMDKATAAGEKQSIVIGEGLGTALADITLMLQKDILPMLASMFHIFEVLKPAIETVTRVIGFLLGTKVGFAALIGILWSLVAAKIAVAIASVAATTGVLAPTFIPAIMGAIGWALAADIAMTGAAAATSSLPWYEYGGKVEGTKYGTPVIVGENYTDEEILSPKGYGKELFTGGRSTISGGINIYGDITVVANSPRDFVRQLKEDRYRG